MDISAPKPSLRKTVGLVLGPILFFVILAMQPFGLTAEAAAVLAGTAWVVIWWVSEAVPIPVTSLLPIVLFPATGAVPVGQATAPYADPIVFLLLGGFLLALAVERWNLHHRISLTVIDFMGTRPKRLLLGFMFATGLLSMWISNTATAMLMVPIAMAVIVELTEFRPSVRVQDELADLESPNPPDAVSGELVHRIDTDPTELPSTKFGMALMLGIAYAASVGGAATLIGSPPNAILAGVAEANLGVEIGFLEWMFVGVPTAFIMLVLTWVALVVLLRPELPEWPERGTIIRDQLDALGAMSTGERRVLIVFSIVAVGWMTRPFVLQPILPFVTDAVIAVVGGICMFLVPVDWSRREFLLDWEYTTRLPWGVLLLLGAGFSIARAFQETGLDGFVAQAITGLGVTTVLGVIVLVAIVVVLLTNVTSNTATASLFMPIMVSVGIALEITPLSLMATAAFAASFAFMLPVATAPNAIVFGSGYLTIPQMVRIGGWLTLIAVVVISLMMFFWLPLVWA